jgi:succinate-semialdehyde dehydrogenase / glutarate-semialdehyde dehydrogenase
MHFGYKQLYIDGDLRDSSNGAKHQVICPGTEEPVAEIAWATRQDAEAALASAGSAFDSWSKTSLKDRAGWMGLLRQAVIKKEEMLRLSVMYEMGKPWEATAEDYQTVVDALEWYAEEMKHTRDVILPDVENTHRHQIISQPVGVVVAFLAWNFPLLNVGFKLGPALASGCTIILKPSSSSPLSAYALGEICKEVDLPKGVVSILCGPADEVATTLSSSPIPRLVTLIGSSETGRKLVAQSATSIKRMSMELGGNAPVLVFPDADLEAAAREVAALKFGNCGQICVSPNRIFVHHDVFERFEHLLRQQACQVKVGFGRESNPTMGPMIDAKARGRLHRLVLDALHDGAKLVCGGEMPSQERKGFFYPPTILRDVRPNMRIAREEIFGPVVPLIEFTDEESVIREANNTEYGLAAYAYTPDNSRAQRLGELLEFGEVMINGFKYAIYLPHGGIKESGIGKDCSHLALDDYLIKKRITVRL